MINVKVRKVHPSITIDADFEIADAGISVLFGESGAGKSSIINMIAGLTEPTEGFISADGKTLFDSAKNINLPPNKRKTGYVFQDSRLFPHMNARRNLLYGADKKNNELPAIAELLGIAHLLDRYPENLSGGEKQRVAIGRALLSSPKILLMDEPMASLDSARRDELLSYIALIAKEFKIPVIYVTHAMEEILRLADNVGIMSKGRLLCFGKAVDTLNSKAVLKMLPDKDFGSVWEGKVVSSGDSIKLGIVDFGGGQIEVAAGDIPVNASVRFKIPAQDVVLSREQTPTVARNIYRGVISDAVMRDYFADVLLDISGVFLWARITRQSFNELGLENGNTMYATIKSVVASSQFYLKS